MKKPSTSKSPKTSQHDSPRRRFQVLTLEERIAPLSCAAPYEPCGEVKGHYNPQGKWVGAGRGGRISCCLG